MMSKSKEVFSFAFKLVHLQWANKHTTVPKAEENEGAFLAKKDRKKHGVVAW